MKRICWIGMAMAALATALPAAAQGAADVGKALSSERFTLVSPFPPGGPTDTLARVLAEGLSARYKTPAVVENATGAAGNIGMEKVKRAKGDGHTLLVIPAGNLTINPTLMPNFPFDIRKDFVPVTMLAAAPNVIVTGKASGIRSIAELIARAKAKPGTLNFGSSGVGNSIHLAVEQFNAAVGIKAVHVPFKTGNETDTAMIAGEVQYTIASLATSLPLIQAGRIKALAVTGEGRDPALPNVPNLSESGLPVRIPDQLFGMVGPANMPAPVTSKLLKAVADMQADPAFQESVRRTGGVPSLVHGEAFRNLALSDSQTWGDLIKRLGITLSS